MANENKTINLDNLSEKELQDLNRTMLDSDPENLEVEIVQKQSEEPATSGTPNIIEIKTEGDGGKSADIKPADTTKEPDKPAPAPTQVSDEEAYKTLIGKFPALSRFKDVQEIRTYIDNMKEPEPEPEPQGEFPLTKEQEAQAITEKIFEVLETDSKAGDLLKQLSATSKTLHEEDDKIPLITSMPTTMQQWSDLYKVDQFLANELRTRANEIGRGVTASMEALKKDYMNAPATNEKALKDFGTDVGNYVTKLHSTATEEDVKELKAKLIQFGEKAVKDNKYYINRNGVPVLNKDLLFADFIVQNGESFAKLTQLGAVKASAVKTKEMLENASKGVSQVSMASKGYTGNAQKRVDLNKQSDLDNMSEAEMKATMQYLDTLAPTE